MIRDRVTEYRVVRAGDLVRNPKNWRTHPEAQRRGLEQLLDKVGSVDVLRTFVLPDGRLCLFDGHLRADIRADEEVRVLVTDLTQEEADIVLATFDPVSAMAGANIGLLEELLDDVKLEVPQDVLDSLNSMIESLQGEADEDKKKDAGLYTRKIEAPIYEPTGERPHLSAMFDTRRSEDLIREIEGEDVPEDLRAFLVAAARRHTVFNYHRIADYYAHATPKVQRLMERSALVIIDYDRAIEEGYVRVYEYMQALRAEDNPDER